VKNLFVIKYQKVPDNIQELLPEAVVYFQSHLEVVFAYLFGSLAKGKPMLLSDVDIRAGGKFPTGKGT